MSFQIELVRRVFDKVDAQPLYFNITAAGAVDRESGGGHIGRNSRFSLIFDFFFVGFGLREVSQRRDLKILLQLAFGRARDDF